MPLLPLLPRPAATAAAAVTPGDLTEDLDIMGVWAGSGRSHGRAGSNTPLTLGCTVRAPPKRHL